MDGGVTCGLIKNVTENDFMDWIGVKWVGVLGPG